VLDAICLSWLSRNGVQRASEATKGWLIFYIFDLESFEHKEDPVRSQMKALAFNRLCTPFYAPILSPAPLFYYYHVLMKKAVLIT